MEGWIAVFAALIAAFAAVGLAILNVAEVRAIQEQVKASQAQVDNQQRPVIAPLGAPAFQSDHDDWLNWGASEQPPIALRVTTLALVLHLTSLACCTAPPHTCTTAQTASNILKSRQLTGLGD
jgi:hypothetical protein